MADVADLRKRLRLAALLSLLSVLAACGSAMRWDGASAGETHVVRKGETLYSIAFRYGMDAEDVARWNRLGDGSLIYPGQVLVLTPRGAPSKPGATPSARRSPASPPRSLPKIPEQPAPAWAWPTAGKVNVEFGGKPGPGTGVLINGRQGQPVLAAAGGRVVYAGSGLIGYGQLIIVKHNDTYLSAYGYNRSLLVKEGQSIKRGQRIATMGEGPERKSRLHFEIRRNGEPVDPRGLLPGR
ncbi:MAG: peptidoglycan DD-metalloendopeptidase family protein [Pseudomonadota bacterium]